MSTHYLARELSEAAVHEASVAQREYAANDWLCDPAGFSFIAENNLGAFDIGDTVPMLGGTRLQVNLAGGGAHSHLERVGNRGGG